MAPRISFVGPERDFLERPYDGLALRHQRLIDAVSSGATISTIVLTPDRRDVQGAAWAIEPGAQVALPPRTSDGRAARIHRLVLGRPRRPADELRDELRRLAGESEPDAVVTFGPWLDEELSPLFGSWPCVHVFDEELSRMPDLAPQTTKARALRRAELVVRRHRLAVPDTVVVISEQEVGYARRRYGSSPAVVVVPQTLPQPQWRPYSDRSAGDSVIAIGNFSEPRNADGLVDFIRVLGARWICRQSCRS